jgi:hypothetical protein
MEGVCWQQICLQGLELSQDGVVEGCSEYKKRNHSIVLVTKNRHNIFYSAVLHDFQ